MPERYGCTVIGAGPGGYTAAIRAGQLGMRTLLIERAELGGICLNAGCIPSKSLIHAGRLLAHARRGSALGLDGTLTLNASRLQAWKRGIVSKLREGVAYLCRKNGVETLHGEARFVSPDEVEVVSGRGPRRVRSEMFVIATGSSPLPLPGLTPDGVHILTVSDALELEHMPSSLAMVGGGVSGMEIGMFLASMGVEVSVVEMMPTILPGVEPDLVRVVRRSAERTGMAIHTSTRVLSWEGGRVTVRSDTGGLLTLPAEKVVVGVGRRPNTASLGLEEAGVTTDEHGFIQVDGYCRTSADDIYAVGDVTGPPMLAHKAALEGVIAVETAAGGSPTPRDENVIPSVIYTDPEIVSAGMGEREAEEQGEPFVVGRFPFSALGRAVSSGWSEGSVKVLAHQGTHRILGIHIVGAGVSDLAGECALILKMGATLEDVSRTAHAHPTLGEAIKEACDAALGKAIHILNRRVKATSQSDAHRSG